LSTADRRASQACDRLGSAAMRCVTHSSFQKCFENCESAWPAATDASVAATRSTEATTISRNEIVLSVA